MKVTVTSVAATVEMLSNTVNARFEQIDARFEQIDRRFEEVDRRFEKIDRRFEEVDRRFEMIDRRFDEVDRRFDAIEVRISAEGEAVRRYVDERMQGAVEEMRRFFEIVAEQMKAERNLVLDGSAATGQEVERLRASNIADHVVFEKTLADHETRLRRLESQ